VRRRSWTRQVINLVYLKFNWFDDIMYMQTGDNRQRSGRIDKDHRYPLKRSTHTHDRTVCLPKVWMVEPVFDVPLLPGKEVVDDDHFVPFHHEFVDQMTPNKASPTRDQYFHPPMIW